MNGSLLGGSNMKKSIIVAISALTFSQVALAERAEIFNCLEKSTMSANESCMVKTIEKETQKNHFFQELALKKVVNEKAAFATVSHYPKKNLIVVKSLEERSKVLLAAN